MNASPWRSFVERGRREALGHLHQRQHPLLCTRAPPLEATLTTGKAVLGGPLERIGDLFAHHGAHRAAQKFEVEND